MLRAILFDMGGTLDGDGLHWLDRFEKSYAAAGVLLPRGALRAAFDEAERQAAVDETIAAAHLDDMVDRHVGWQLRHLSLDNPRLRREVAARFVRSVRDSARANAPLLAGLKLRGLQLGVVSNGCGNVDRLCEDLGYASFLSIVVDSRRVGLYKPDPAIYVYAAARLGLPPSSILMVGDSFDRDVRPAKAIGMQTAWLEGPAGRNCPDRALADVSLPALADLPEVLDRQARIVA
jgi:HAD superfamily hydrolase (TIGR01509 family)